MKKFLRYFLRFCLFLLYIIDICVMLIYLTLLFARYGLAIGLYQMLLYPPLLVFFIFLFGIFVAGTILIVKREKNFHAKQLQNLSIEKAPDKYKIIQGFTKGLIIGLITLFYITDISAIFVFSLWLLDEIKRMNNLNRLPSSLNMSIESITLYLIICIVSFIIVTAVLIIKNRKKKKLLKEDKNKSE